MQIVYASKLCFLVAVVLSLSNGAIDNLETRNPRIIEANKNETEKMNFGASVVAVSTPGSATITVYVGAPTSGYSPRLSPGAIHVCHVSNHTSHCQEFVGQGNLGISLAYSRFQSSLMTCAHHYSINCPDSNNPLRVPGQCQVLNESGIVLALASPCSSECPVPSIHADIIFVLDESFSVGIASYNEAKEWIVGVISQFRTAIDEGRVIVGLIRFATKTTLEIWLAKRSFTSLEGKILGTPYHGGGTYTGSAIDRAVNEFAVRGRNGIAKLIVLITDGNGADNPEVAARNARNCQKLTCVLLISLNGKFWSLKMKLYGKKGAKLDSVFSRINKNIREKGIILVAIGVARADAKELEKIANDKDKVFSVDNYNSLNGILSSLQNIINDVAVTLEDDALADDFINCLSGISSHIAKDNSIHVGTVGAFGRSGAVVCYSSNVFGINNVDNSFHVHSSSMFSSENSETVFDEAYLGYSLSSGSFYNNGLTHVVCGAPRYQSKGIVVGFQVFSGNASFSIHPMGTLWQLGAYFGQSVLGVDLNNDNFDDLLVSAPLYSHQGGYDQGRVFVYMNDPANPGPAKWNLSTFTPLLLQGSNNVHARFGFSMEIAGDVNLDGFNDIIIGAPGEDKSVATSGAVYLYYASIDGLQESNKQRVVGHSIAPQLQNFGAAVGGTFDFDQNGYPDVIIGAPSSNKVVVLKSRQILDVASEIAFIGTNIVDVITCAENLGLPCVEVKICLNISRRDGKPLQNTYSKIFTCAVIESTLAMDTNVHKNKRLVFFNVKESVTKFASQHNSTRKQCFLHGLQLTASTIHSAANFDFMAPAKMEHTFDLQDHIKLRHMSPLLSAKISQPIYLNFSLGCSTSRCIHDLQLSAKSMVNESVVVVENFHQVFSVEVTLTNQGRDPAYFVQFNIWFTDVPFIKSVSDCADVTQINISSRMVAFQFQSASVYKHRMKSGTVCSALLYFDLSHLAAEGEISMFEITGLLFTSTEGNMSSDPNPHNNKFSIHHQLMYKAEIDIIGAADTLLFYDESLPDFGVKNSSSINHNYRIQNRGPSTLHKGQITLTWPEKSIAGGYLMALDSLSCEPVENCWCGAVNNKIKTSHQDVAQVDLPYHYSCDDVSCSSITCELRNLRAHYYVTISAGFTPVIPPFITHPGFRLFSHVSLDVSSSPLQERNVEINSSLSTSVQKLTAPTDNEVVELNPVHIIAGILGGLGGLAVTVAIMWKMGFFESKYANMKRELQEAEENNEPAYENVNGNEQPAD